MTRCFVFFVLNLLVSENYITIYEYELVYGCTYFIWDLIPLTIVMCIHYQNFSESLRLDKEAQNRRSTKFDGNLDDENIIENQTYINAGGSLLQPHRSHRSSDASDQSDATETGRFTTSSNNKSASDRAQSCTPMINTMMSSRDNGMPNTLVATSVNVEDERPHRPMSSQLYISNMEPLDFTSGEDTDETRSSFFKSS